MAVDTGEVRFTLPKGDHFKNDSSQRISILGHSERRLKFRLERDPGMCFLVSDCEAIPHLQQVNSFRTI